LINFPGFQRLYNVTNEQPSLLLRNTSGGLVITLPAVPGTFDLRQEAMRKLFVADAMHAVESGAFDGVFIDRANYAARAVLDLKSGPPAMQRHLASLGWDLPTATSLVAAQTQLFVDLTAALGQDRVVLAKETGGGAGFLDWHVANAAMITDTFCSNYAPPTVPPNAPPQAYTQNKSCDGWSEAVRGHVPLNGSTIWDGRNMSSFAACEEWCCQSGESCAAVLYNTQIKKCIRLANPFTRKFTCMADEGVEWLANKRAPGAPGCKPPHPAPPPMPNSTGLWNATQCTVRVFRQKITLEDAIGSHTPARFKRADV